MSGLTIQTDGEKPRVFVATERLALTEDDQLVPESHADARWLFCIVGQEIPYADAERYGLTAKSRRPRPRKKD